MGILTPPPVHLDDPLGRDMEPEKTKEQPRTDQPGGRTSRGPATDSGGEQDPQTPWKGEDDHGWAPDAPGEGEAKERAIAANKKAFEANETQDAATAPGGQYDADPDPAAEHVGESISRRGEDVVDEEGTDPGREDLGTKGKTERPVGTSTARASTGVDPQDPDD